MNLDILFCVTPHHDIEVPVIAPAILNSIVKKNNYKTKMLDLNMSLFKQKDKIFKEHDKAWSKLDTLFLPSNNLLEDNKNYHLLIKQWTQDILNYNPTYVAFSVLSSFNYWSIYYLSIQLKKSNPNIKIIVGGVSAYWFKIFMEQKKQFHLIDNIVIGYGEVEIINILKEKQLTQIIEQQNFEYIDNIIPDYSDINLRDYSKRILYLSTSRGCIYNCSFCQVSQIWKKFLLRPVDHIIEELLFMKNTYNITDFKLTDSIINAVLPNMRSLCNTLKDYNFTWDAMFSIRNKIMVENDYKLLKDAGCRLLLIGIESGSLQVRNHMGKTFTNQDVLQTLEYLNKYKIDVCLMFIVGYPTETMQDFVLTKDLINQIKKKNYDINISIRAQYIFLDNISRLKKYLDNKNFKDRFNRYNKLREYISTENFKLKSDTRLKNWVDKLYKKK